MKENHDLFITPHAVSQFQKRIAALDDGAARQMIRDGILRSRNVRVLPDGATVRVRTRRPFPFEFRAFCVYDARHRCPVVTTIVRGDSGVTRKRRRRKLLQGSRQDEASIGNVNKTRERLLECSDISEPWAEFALADFDCESGDTSPQSKSNGPRASTNGS